MNQNITTYSNSSFRSSYRPDACQPELVNLDFLCRLVGMRSYIGFNDRLSPMTEDGLSMTGVTSRFRQISDEVYHAINESVSFDDNDVAILKDIAAKTPRRRARLCAHRDVSSGLQEMLIVHPRDAYVRPHIHKAAAESILIVDGEVKLVLFNNDGRPTSSISMAAPHVGRTFFTRIPPDTFHTFIIQSEWLAFLETKVGPFDRAQMIFAPWSPPEHDAQAALLYQQHLVKQVELS